MIIEKERKRPIKKKIYERLENKEWKEENIGREE